MTLASYRIDYCVNLVQKPCWKDWRGWPVALSGLISDKEEVKKRLNSCKSGYANHTICVQKILDNFTVISRTCTDEHRQLISEFWVELAGKVKRVRYVADGHPGNIVNGNVLPLSIGVHLATDWNEPTVTTFVSPSYHYYYAHDEYLDLARRGRTVSLSESGRIGGITRDDDHLIARVGLGPEIHFYRLDQIVISDELVKKTIKVQRIVRPKCLDKSGLYQDIILNEIEYEPKSKKLWGVQEESARIIEFDIESGKCVGELNLFDALKNYAVEKSPPAFKFGWLSFNFEVNKFELTPFSVVNGIFFLAENWLMVSMVNSTTRFILQIER